MTQANNVVLVVVDQESKKRQKRLMVSVGLSCLCTLVFFVSPVVLRQGLDMYSDGVAAWLVTFMFIIQNINPAMNFLIWTIRHKDLRLALKYLITCKELTEAKINQKPVKLKVQTTK